MIRNPVAADLARELAALRHQTMSDAVIDALRNELRRERETKPLAERLKEIADDLAAKSRGPGRDVTKAERDSWWGHDDCS